MNKKFINGLLLATLVVGSAGSFTSCKDYDDDIDNLQSQIDAINVDLGKLQEELRSGKVITSVAETSTGIAITLSDGKVLNLTNGKDGAPGAPGTTWTIGTDGYWYENGKKTDYRAIGEKGDKGDKGDTGAPGAPGQPGQPGAPGADGTDGANGKYYVPESDGYFWIYQDGKKIENSGIRWQVETGSSSSNPSLTAAFTGNKLIVSNVEIGKDENGNPVYGTKEFDMGTPVGSLEFIPTVMSSTVAYPTTDKPFFHIVNYLSEAKYNSTTKAFIPQSGWNKSNIVEVAYRINPSDAYVYPYGNASFIGRQVVSRAAGDVEQVLNVVSSKVLSSDGTELTKNYDLANGEISLKTTINAGKLSNSKENIAALSLWNGQNRTVSDYIGISSKAIEPILVDSAYLKANPTTAITGYKYRLYPRTQAIVSKTSETSAFIQQFCALNDAANYEMVYTGDLDLTKIPGLYCVSEGDWLSKLGFVGMSYEFSLPSEYNSDDVQHTNQQWFVKLVDNKLTVNTDQGHLTDGKTPAIGRTPVVRVDAFLTDNSGEKQLIASAYIKVAIVKDKPTQSEDLGDLPVPMTQQAYEYHALKSTKTLVGQMDWKTVNNKIYGATGLTSSTFWDFYGGANDNYDVTVSVTGVNGSQIELASGKAQANNTFSLSAKGIFCETTLGNGDTQTSNIKFEIDNMVGTQHNPAYKNVKVDDKFKGAEYTVTITIPADNNKSRKNVVITQKFYVYCESTPFSFNPNYYAGKSYEGYENVVITKGKLVGGKWALQMNISEVFAMIGGKNIFEYYNTINNAKDIKFSLNPTTQTGVSYTETGSPATNGTIALTAALTQDKLVAGMKYDITLVNGELCDPVYFNIWFNNPFRGTTGTALTLNGNETGAVSVAAAHSVLVKDIDGATIYSWVNNALALSSKALNTYKVAAPTVKYAFVEDEAYKTFKGNLDPEATFGINANTGVVTYDNLGATLIPSYNLTIKATVTFTDLSEVTCTIPLKVQGKNN